VTGGSFGRERNTFRSRLRSRRVQEGVNAFDGLRMSGVLVSAAQPVLPRWRSLAKRPTEHNHNQALRSVGPLGLPGTILIEGRGTAAMTSEDQDALRGATVERR
jgi:hypothetical protein